MYCTKCGAQIPADARFCTKCGIAVQSFVNQNIEEVNPIAQDDVQIDMKQETEPQAEENVHLQVEENVQPQVESITCVNIQPEAWQVERLPIESEKTKKKLISPIMIIIVGTLLIIVTALFLHILGDGESKLKNISPIGAESTDEESDEKEDEQKPVEAELNSEPKTVDMLLSEGKDYLLDGDYKNAMLSYNEAKALDNGNTDIFLFGADVYLAQDNFIEALAILEEGIERSGSEKLDFRKAYVLNNIAIKECISENHYWDRVYEYDKYGNLLRDIYQEYTYDGNGNLIEETCYDENNNFIEKHGFKYNSAGKIIQMMNYTEDGSPLGWTQYEYSENGKIVNEVYYNENSEISFWYGYAYSKDGILEKKIYHESDGDVAFLYEYYAAVNQLSEIHNISDGKVNWWNELVYDEKGNVLSEVEYNYRGKINWRGEYTYDENGNRLKSVTYGRDNKITDWREHEYNEAGKKTKSICCKYDGTPLWWIEYTYDESGNEIKYTEYNKNGIATDWRETEYSTDKDGNTVITTYDEKGQKENQLTINAIGYIINEYTASNNVEYNYCYTYIGDIASLNEITMISGILQVANETTLYRRRTPHRQATPLAGEKGGLYQVVGETDEFYLLEDGWYTLKEQPGLTFQKR